MLTLYRAERRRQSGALTWHERQPDDDLTAVNNMTLFYSYLHKKRWRAQFVQVLIRSEIPYKIKKYYRDLKYCLYNDFMFFFLNP